jgi:hypothetical protein
LWLPPAAARSLASTMVALDEGQIIERKNQDDPSVIEKFTIKFETNAIKALRTLYGSLRAATEAMPFEEMLSPIPRFARVGDGYFGDIEDNAASVDWIRSKLHADADMVASDEQYLRHLVREEQIAVAVVLSRADLLQKLGCLTPDDAFSQMGNLRSNACRSVRQNRENIT